MNNLKRFWHIHTQSGDSIILKRFVYFISWLSHQRSCKAIFLELCSCFCHQKAHVFVLSCLLMFIFIVWLTGGSFVIFHMQCIELMPIKVNVLNKSIYYYLLSNNNGRDHSTKKGYSMHKHHALAWKPPRRRPVSEQCHWKYLSFPQLRTHSQATENLTLVSWPWCAEKDCRDKANSMQ